MQRTDQELVAVVAGGVLQGAITPGLRFLARARRKAGGVSLTRADLARGGGIAKKPIQKSSPSHAGKFAAEKFFPRISGVGPGAENPAAEKSLSATRGWGS